MTTLHQSEIQMAVANVKVKAGDTIDFIVDIADGLNSDQFLWEPVVTMDTVKWNAHEEFVGPSKEPDYLTPWEQYAQILLLSNEFAFVD